MTREEALKAANEMHHWLMTDREKEALETLIPELKESEDEKIRKELIKEFEAKLHKCFEWKEGIPNRRVLDWLEKQKEENHDGKKWIYEDEYRKDLYRSFNDGMDEVLENPGKYGFQREQKSLTISAASEWLRKHVCAYMNSEYNEFHKCVEYDGSIDKERLVNDFEEAMQKEEKPECDNETEVQKAYREGKNAGRKEVFDHPEYYGLQLRRTYDYETGEKIPECSEEDEKTINELCDIIASNAKNGYLGGYYAPDLVKKLKSLHNQPKQEWSKEDENKVERLAFLVSIAAEKEMISEEECIDLRRFVKSYHPQLKKEWSEEDEKMLYQVLCYLDPTITRAKREEIELWLKSLLERFNLQPKQERNEEDEKVRKWLLEYFYLHKDDLRGASVTSMEILSFLDNHTGNGGACDADEFNPQPGEKFWVRCKTDKSENLWFDKGDERQAYGVTDADGFMTYIVYLNIDGKGNAVSYHDKKKFLETFDILDGKTAEQWPKLSNCKHDCRTCFAKCLYRKERNPEQ